MERNIAENKARDFKIDVTQVVSEFWLVWGKLNADWC